MLGRVSHSARIGIWLAGASLLAACGSDGPTQSTGVGEVRFEYRQSTQLDPAVAQAFPDCVAGVGHAHIHPSWRGFQRVDLIAAGPSLWEITFQDVPVGQREAIRVSDPNVCADNPTGASTEGVFANGVELVEVVDTPGSGIEPGLALTLEADGEVRP